MSLTAELEVFSSGTTKRLHLTNSPLLPHRGHTAAVQSRQTKFAKVEIPEFANNHLNQRKLIFHDIFNKMFGLVFM